MKRIRKARLAPLPALLAALALAACTSTQDVLEPSALQSNAASGATPPAEFPLAPPASASGTTTSAVASPIVSSAKVRFAPVVGAPTTASAPLATRLNTRAEQRGIGLVGADDGSATLVMKGYFSAISDAGETTVIYVWDVTDQSGTRVHRIQGQAKGQSAQDGWAGVQSSTMEAIADQTVDQLAQWLSTSQG